MAVRSQLYRDLLFFLKDLISDNVTDPVSSARGGSSAFVMTSFPEREVKYPLITIQINNTSERSAGLQVGTMDVILTAEIRIWSQSVTQSDQLCQQILDLLADNQYTASSGSIANDFHDFNILSCVRVDEPGQGGVKS